MFDFIEKHKPELIAHIMGMCSNCVIEDNDEIEDWILNDEGLYNWAEDEGVTI